MNKTIYKYELARVEMQDVHLPEGAEVLTVQWQGGKVCLWALVAPDAPSQRRAFEILCTGQPIATAFASGATIKRQYISTIQSEFGALVLHIFERLSN